MRADHQHSVRMSARTYRDAKWAVQSPSFFSVSGLKPPSPDWFDEVWSERNPSSWDDSQHDYRFRLGRYFESLWHDVLADHRIFPLVESNLTLQGDGRTLGELDLLVGAKQLEHWELAVKLYLCVGDQEDPCHWIGPSLRDRLGIKRDHLSQHQLAHTDDPVIRAWLAERYGQPVSRIRAIIKGWGFYPYDDWSSGVKPPQFLNPLHLRGWWMTREEFEARFHGGGHHYRVLAKPYWLSPISSEDQPLTPGLLALDQSEANEPTAQLVALLTRSGNERSRGFIVSEEWLEQAQALVSATS